MKEIEVLYQKMKGKRIKVRVLKSDKSLDLKAGVYDAEPYWLDPHEKVTIFDKKGDAICNQYRDEIEVIKSD